MGYLDDQPVATGAWRLREDVTFQGTTKTAEIKRMYVVPQPHRRPGHQDAGASGVNSQVCGRCRHGVETGSQQPEAISLYRHCGYVETLASVSTATLLSHGRSASPCQA
ncbi:MAG: hypothetical protein R2709_14685 [Marmoricola sp.]